jgi:hypothetical protein
MHDPARMLRRARVCMSVCVCWARQAELFVDPADKEDLPEVFDDLDMWVCWTCICVRVYMEERRRRGGEGGYLSPSQVLMAVCVCVCVCVCACVCVCVCVCVWYAGMCRSCQTSGVGRCRTPTTSRGQSVSLPWSLVHYPHSLWGSMNHHTYARDWLRFECSM